MAKKCPLFKVWGVTPFFLLSVGQVNFYGGVFTQKMTQEVVKLTAKCQVFSLTQFRFVSCTYFVKVKNFSQKRKYKSTLKQKLNICNATNQSLNYLFSYNFYSVCNSVLRILTQVHFKKLIITVQIALSGVQMKTKKNNCSKQPCNWYIDWLINKIFQLLL